MKQKYVYMLSQKSTGTPVQDVFLSREESRQAKRLFEERDGTKYGIVRFEFNKTVR